MRILQSSVALFIVGFVSACAPALSMRTQAVPAPPPIAANPAMATVVFLRPGGGGANAIIDESGRALGELPTPSKVVVTVPPGKHTFVKTMYKDAGTGDFQLPEGAKAICRQVSGDFEAGKIYFVEASVFQLFVVKPSDERLAQWTGLPLFQMAPAASASVASDPQWQPCLAAAQGHATEAKDMRNVVTPADGLATWPGSQ